MPTQADSYGFEDLRTYVQTNWAFIAVVDSTGTEILRWDANNNANVTWTSGPASNPLTAELVITGQDLIDAGASLPVTLVRTDAFKSDAASTRVGHDPYTNATFEEEADKLTITHNYRLPP